MPGKNVHPLAGVPLIAWAIGAGRRAKRVDRTIVTTDSADIAEVSRRYGAEVPFLRPSDLAQDTSPDRAYIDHALDFLAKEGRTPECIVILRPTTPVRDPAQVDASIEMLKSRHDATSLRSVHALPEPPQKMMGIEGGWLTGLFPHDPRPEYYNLPRQSFPTAYQPNGYVDIVTTAWLQGNRGGIFGPRVLGFVTEPVVEVDTIEAIELLEFQVARRRPALLDGLAATA